MAQSGIFGKLNLKDQRDVVVLNAPPSFEAELRKLEGVQVHTELRRGRPVCFALAFATRKAEVDSIAQRLADVAEGDAIVWFAYPKGTSKRYTCDFNRDTGWDALGERGFEPVRQVAIDEDWSALRFRRAEFIRTLKRAPQRAISEQGRTKATASTSRAGGTKR